MGESPYYVLLQNYHLCHLEIAKTIRRVLNGGGVLLNNSEKPTISIASIAKVPITPGYSIKRGIGSFEFRGIAVRISENKGHVPIGLLADAVITKNIEAGQQISFDDIEIPESKALRIWQEIEQGIQ
jgi:predicted homoserine dehydrogenase-like protein